MAPLPCCGWGHRVGDVPVPRLDLTGALTADRTSGERFKMSIDAIYNQTDDCIVFSRILAEDLLTYGNRLRRKNAWKYRLGIPPLKRIGPSRRNKD